MVIQVVGSNVFTVHSVAGSSSVSSFTPKLRFGIVWPINSKAISRLFRLVDVYFDDIQFQIRLVNAVLYARVTFDIYCGVSHVVGPRLRNALPIAIKCCGSL